MAVSVGVQHSHLFAWVDGECVQLSVVLGSQEVQAAIVTKRAPLRVDDHLGQSDRQCHVTVQRTAEIMSTVRHPKHYTDTVSIINDTVSVINDTVSLTNDTVIQGQ